MVRIYADRARGQFVLPPDFTFTPGGVVVHKDTYQLLVDLMEQAQNRDPDLHGMYIYNGKPHHDEVVYAGAECT